MLELVLTAGVLGFVAFRLGEAAHFALGPAGRPRVRAIVAGIRWRHLWPVPFVLTAVVAVAVVLLEVPGLSWGWWMALGGEGNPVTGTTELTTGTALERLLPVVFLLLFLPSLPLFALQEEQVFRRGAEGWSAGRRVVKAVQFGMVHALIGIPIGAALALSVGGAYFQWVYLRGFRASGGSTRAALLESARAHTAYNVAIVAIVLAAVLGP